jgi:hypothetical protein
MREALSILLDGKCYHMAEVFMGKEKDWNFWDRALDDLDRNEKSVSTEVKNKTKCIMNCGYSQGYKPMDVLHNPKKQ